MSLAQRSSSALRRLASSAALSATTTRRIRSSRQWQHGAAWPCAADTCRRRRLSGSTPPPAVRRAACGGSSKAPCAAARSAARRGVQASAGQRDGPPGTGASSSTPRLPTTGGTALVRPTPGFRLFSNLHPETLKHEPGTVWGAAALVSGTTVGAGILALPTVTAGAGFGPSAAALAAFACYNMLTGLLIAEVNLNFLCEMGASRGVSLSSMAKRTLGDAGAATVSATYLLLHYALLVAYVAKAGETVQQATGLPLVVADAAFIAAFGGLCYGARPTTLDAVNSALVVLVIASFVGLLGVAASDVQPELLAVADWGQLPDALPVIALSFVYQNTVPVICSSLEGDVGKIRQAIVLGSLVPLAMFAAWDAAILGSGGGGVAAAAAADPLAALRAASTLAAPLIDAFSFLAIATSFIGFVLGLSDFLADLLQLPTGRQPVPYLLTLLPPLAMALSFPDLFVSALDFAGTYGVLVLFGLMPVAMAWSERYGGTTLTRLQVAPGGRPLLVATAGVAAAIIGRELFTSAAALAG